MGTEPSHGLHCAKKGVDGPQGASFSHSKAGTLVPDSTESIIVFLGVPGKHCINISINCHLLSQINHVTNPSEITQLLKSSSRIMSHVNGCSCLQTSYYTIQVVT